MKLLNKWITCSNKNLDPNESQSFQDSKSWKQVIFKTAINWTLSFWGGDYSILGIFISAALLSRNIWVKGLAVMERETCWYSEDENVTRTVVSIFSKVVRMIWHLKWAFPLYFWLNFHFWTLHPQLQDYFSNNFTQVHIIIIKKILKIHYIYHVMIQNHCWFKRDTVCQITFYTHRGRICWLQLLSYTGEYKDRVIKFNWSLLANNSMGIWIELWRLGELQWTTDE